MNESHDSVSLDQVLRVLRRRRLLVLQCILAGIGAGLLVAWSSEERYESTATVLVEGASEGDAGLNAEAAARLVRTRGVAQRVARETQDRRSPGELLGAVSAATDQSGNFVTITASDDEADDAAVLANAFADQFIAVRADRVAARTREALVTGEQQLARLPPRSEERASLRAELAELRAAAVLGGIEAEVVDPAVPGRAVRDFEPVPSGIAGGVLGLLLGLVLAFGLAASDPRVSSLAQLSQLLAVPRLAAIAGPAKRRVRRRVPAVLRADREPFEHLRGALLVFKGERSLRRLVVTSPSDRSEGKTAVAANVGVALAPVGLRVCVVDADLRQPQLASQFGLDRSAPGLAEALRGEPVGESSHRFEIPAARSGAGDGDLPAESVALTVVPSGAVRSDSGLLLASPRLEEVLEELERDHDVVIVEAGPVLAGSESLRLMKEASGAILVIRHSHTRRQAVARAGQIIAETGGTILGVVATGVPRSELDVEGSGAWPAAAMMPTHGA